MPYNPHPCAWCNTTLEPLPNEGSWHYNKRQTCDPETTGRDCRTKHIAAKNKLNASKRYVPKDPRAMPPLKKCENCGKIVPYGDDIPSIYEGRKICRRSENPYCFDSHMKKTASRGCNKVKELAKHKNAPYVPPEPEKPRTAKISESQLQKWDREEREARAALDARYGHQVTTLPAVTLDEATRRELEKVYTPPAMRESDVMPHYHRRRQPW